MYDVLIIGGGAAGLAAACALVRGGKRIALLEKQPRVGRKLLATGNGRCNLTNLNARPEHYHGARAAAEALLKQFPPKETVAFFASLGVPTVADEEGRVYPMSNQAASVLDALRLYAAEMGGELLTECGAESIVKKGGRFCVSAANDRRFEAKNVLVCTGGLAAPKLGACGDGYRLLESFGHSSTPKFPAITALKTPPEPVRALKGQRAECILSLMANDQVLRAERGEALFAEGGVSGIAAMQLARACTQAQRAGKKCALCINFLPDTTEPEAFSMLCERAEALPLRPLEDFLNGIVTKRIGQTLVRATGIEPQTRPADSLTTKEMRALARVLTAWTLPVTGVQGFDQAQVTAGGVRLQDFDLSSMQSLRVPGLYAAGEVLDVDGDCGGFNLQWAWSSALVAAEDILSKRD